MPITEAIGADILFIFVDDYAGLKQFPYYDYFSFDEIEAQTSADNTLSVVYDLQMESDLGLKKFRINVLFFKGRIGDAKILEKTVCVARYLYSEAIFDKNVYDIPRAEEFKQD